jgi:hypothetical protein
MAVSRYRLPGSSYSTPNSLPSTPMTESLNEDDVNMINFDDFSN